MPETNNCLNWPYGRYTNGYGAVYNGYKSVQVNRFVATFFHRPPKNDEVAMHLCNNKLCYNKRHIKWGTQSENIKHWHDSRIAN
jgi:hypothetical protein